MDTPYLPVIELSELPDAIESMDMGEIRWPYVEVSQRRAPAFGKKPEPTFEKRTYRFDFTDDPKASACDSFIDELAKIKNTPLPMDEAADQFGDLLRASGRTPTHVVRVGTNLYAVICARDLHIRTALLDGQLVSTLVSLFYKFPVFRLRSDR